MIPSLGTLIAAYVAFRIFEILAQGKARHPSDGARAATLICGIVALVVIGFFWMNLMFSGLSSSASSLSGTP